MVTVFVAIGSNIDRHRSITSALKAIEQKFGPLVISPVYECDAVGFDGDPFFNLVIKFDTELDANYVADTLDQIEHDCGRTRDSARMAPRVIDLDLLLYGDLVDADEKVRVPRSDILDYAFVLKPLTDIAPDARHPLTTKTYREHWSEFNQQQLPLRVVDFSLEYYEEAAGEGC